MINHQILDDTATDQYLVFSSLVYSPGHWGTDTKLKHVQYKQSVILQSFYLSSMNKKYSYSYAKVK